MSKPMPLTDEEVRDLRQIRDAYRAGRLVMITLIGIGSIATAVVSFFTLIHWK